MYNTILRKFPTDHYRFFEENRNLFPTSIFVLVSAIQKLSRVTSYSAELRLYRGLGGNVTLPEAFYSRDENGCSGFTEWGCMSTTSIREVAINYSGVKKLRPLPIVLEIKGGSVDKGACIQEFSQYPAENECLFVPCSFLEQVSHHCLEITKDGIVIVIPVRVNVNLKTMTVDEYVQQQKAMHISSFRYVIEEIKQQVHSEETKEKAVKRLELDPTAGPTSVKAFLDDIVAKCNGVYQRHQAVNSADYIDEKKFRKLVLDMVDVRMMAMSKLHEWFENTSSSFIQYRISAELRTVHRRRITFLAQQLASESLQSSKRVELALVLSTAKGLIINSIDEKNDLGETVLMAAAAEGRTAGDLKILVEAKANLSASRADGVCAIWLAAQFGHDHCIAALADMKACVDQLAADRTSPFSIAAQMGNFECVKLLEKLKADVNTSNVIGLTALHQAAMNGHHDIVSLLVGYGVDTQKTEAKGNTALMLASKHNHRECVKILQESGCNMASMHVQPPTLTDKSEKKLIISTGDISDVDGLFALVEYRKTGADVLFVMNYPAYIGISPVDVDPSYEEMNPGLGFKYCVEDVVQNSTTQVLGSYQRLREAYGGLSNATQMKAALTDVAFEILSKIWLEGQENRGKLFFCIGGINSINPFSSTAIKNELFAYADLVSEPKHKLALAEKQIYCAETAQVCEINLERYSEIYIDFNGPMSFFHQVWREDLSRPEVVHNIKGAFIMGGVFSSEKPVTMPSIKGKINRFSSATMNQLYHPQHSADFFAFLNSFNIPAFVVANNVVRDLLTYEDGSKEIVNIRGIEEFLVSNGLQGDFLKQLALAHYTGSHKPPRKPFDYYTALALTAFLRCSAKTSSWPSWPSKRLFYSNVYGLALISQHESWETTRTEYASKIDTTSKNEEAASEKVKKESFRKELEIMSKLDVMDSIPVTQVCFKACDQSCQFKLDLDESAP